MFSSIDSCSSTVALSMALRGGGIDRRRRSVSWVMGLSIVGSKMRKAPSSFRMRGLFEKVFSMEAARTRR
jgi:hypothetical protein